jgi:perosamine synthetase
MDIQIPLSVPHISGNEAKYLLECVDSTFVSSVGPFVNRFEEMVALAAGSKGAIATSSGTTGLHLALVSVGVKPGDLVVIPSFTFIATANAVSHAGAEPWLMDIETSSWTLDPALLREELKNKTVKKDGRVVHKNSGKPIGAIMPICTMGVTPDMDALEAIAREYGIPLVIDSAPALGVKYKGTPIGARGDVAVFSFNGNKTVTAGAGGAVVSNKPELLKLARHLSTTARVSQEYDHDRVGYNYRMSNLQAAVGCAQLERLDEFIEAKRRINKAYNESLGTIKGIGVFPSPSWSESVCWFSGVVIEDATFPPVTEICKLLREDGIEARPFWKPMHFQKPYERALQSILTVTESVWNKILTLPCSTNLSISDQKKVIDSLKRILQERN